MFGGRRDDEDPFAALNEQRPGVTARVSTRSAQDAFGEPVGPSRGDGDDGDEARSSAIFGGGRNDGGAAAAASGAPGAPRTRRGSDRALVALAVIACLGAAGGTIFAAERAAQDDPAAVAGDRPAGDPGGRPAGDGGRGDGRDGEGGEQAPPRRVNLVRPAGMRATMRIVRRTIGPGERIQSMRVAPERTFVDLVGRRGRDRNLTIEDDLSTDLTVSSIPSIRRDGLLPRQVDPAAPWRAVRAAARQGRFGPGRIDYLVLSPSLTRLSPTEWSFFFEGVRQRDSHWLASLDGRVAYRPGERPGPDGRPPSAETRTLTIMNNGVKTVLRGAEAKRVSDCVARARARGVDFSPCLP